jgi:predicted transcriptional regulator
MTLRLPDQMEADLRAAADAEHRGLHSTVLHAIESYLINRETAEVKADPEALRNLAEARDAVERGEVMYGVDAVKALVADRVDQ